MMLDELAGAVAGLLEEKLGKETNPANCKAFQQYRGGKRISASYTCNNTVVSVSECDSSSGR
jgi:hypothetical protein